jgi:hypothetical protein
MNPPLHSTADPRRFGPCLIAALLSLSGCISVPKAIVAQPEKIRLAADAVAASQATTIRTLTTIGELAVEKNHELDLAAAEKDRAYRAEALRAGQLQVLEAFDDAAFRLITAGLTVELEGNDAFLRLRAAEQARRVAFTKAVTDEKKYPTDPFIRESTLKAKQDWEDTLRLQVETESRVRNQLTLALAARRELFRAEVAQEFATLKADKSMLPVPPDLPAKGLAATTDSYLLQIQASYASIDQALIELGAALQYESNSLNVGLNVLTGVAQGLGAALNSDSLIASLAGGALAKNAPSLVKDIESAVQRLTAKAQTDVATTGTATAATTATQAAAATTTP